MFRWIIFFVLIVCQDIDESIWSFLSLCLLLFSVVRKHRMQEDDLLRVGQIRLLTRCKILVVASFLHCLQIIFSLKSPSPTLKRHMDLPSLIWVINLLARATLLPWLNVYIISLVKVSSETQRRSVESGKTAATVFKNGRESHWDYSWRPVSRLIRMFVCDLAHTHKK